MAEYQGDYAFVLPENTRGYQLEDQMFARQERDRQEALRQKKEDEARQATLTNTVGDVFDDKNYLTGSNYDPFIRKQLSDARAKYASEIRQNPGMSAADLQFRIQKDMADFGGTASAIKNVRTNVKDAASKLQQFGIDASAAEKLAMDRFIYKTDEKGNKVLKSPDEIDPNQDYLSEVLDEHPELLVNRSTAFNKYLKDARTYEVGDEISTENNGITRKYKSDLKLYPFQEIAMTNGKPAVGQDGKPYIRTKSQRVTIGKERYNMADEQTYMDAMSRPDVKLAIEADFKDYSTRTGVKNGTPESDIIKRVLLHDRLSQVQPVKSSFNSVQSESNFKERLDAGAIGSSIKSGLAEQRKIDKAAAEQDKWDNSKYGIINRALDNDLELLADPDPNEAGYFNVTEQVGKIAVGMDAGKPYTAEAIYVNPSTQTMKIDVGDGKPLFIKGKDAIKKFMIQKARLNGYSLDKVREKLEGTTAKSSSKPSGEKIKGAAGL